ncbi:nitrite reductase/ring-hydroxylating ferredoxin subunit [Thermocatellispora tengchongensis]|uniref:Cytochrome bc1 complex Rieske iron-sulfur subunit n=1 Tax=Thermocatellispora tengchongensis TaxID=1073253 RepID=A0A840PIT5_9ACTN|nr:Rieske (2Fe-2S) protein [Thermocatellispora tengchongensis]MBB5135985.1 nitrite reductase/ring-hydroxylating ferredoxin subunit [Thermocatellispora tengchongensis]
MAEIDNATRRTVIMGVGAGGLAAVLAACGGSGETTAAPAGDGQSSAPAAETSAPAAESSAPAADGALAATADIPEGGGKIFEAQKVVVTQPSAGQFKAFNAMCTHKGCPVGSVEGGSIVCPCHNSKFSISDGSVQGGPATQPLAEVKINVSGDQITLA